MARRLVTVLLLVLISTSSVAAQKKFPVSLDLSVGVSASRSNSSDYWRETREGLAGDVLFALRMRDTPSGTLVGGLSVNVQGPGSYTRLCVPLPAGGCKSAFPEFLAVTSLAGFETQGGALRAMAGPAIIRGSTNGLTEWAPGGQVRLDSAPLTLGPFALVGSIRGTMIPRYRNAQFQLIALSLGLRIG